MGKSFRRLAAGLVGALCSVLVPAAISLGGSDEPGSGRSAAGTRALKQMRHGLERAEDRARAADGEYRDALEDARQGRLLFVKAAFGDYTYLDACEASELLLEAEGASTFAGRGFYEQGERREKFLTKARTAGRNLLNLVVDCAPEHAEAPDRMMKALRRLIRDYEDAKLRDENARLEYRRLLEDIVGQNRELFAATDEQVLGGCEVPGFERSLVELDGMVLTAQGYSEDFLLAVDDDLSKEGAAKESLELRRTVLGHALDGVRDLIREWRTCSRPACADRIDNDEDGGTDQADIGCGSLAGGGYSGDDQSEDQAELPTVVCPPSGVAAPADSPAGTQLTNTNAGNEVERIVLHNVSTGQVLLARDVERDPDALAGGPVSLGPGVCGPGTNTSVFWEVEGTTVTWDFVIVKDDEDVAPPQQRIVAVAGTR